MGLIEKLQAKLELFRLEQRYTRNRHRRSTFISNAVYKDGEYVYQTPNTTGSSSTSSSPSSSPWSHNGSTPEVVVEEPESYRRSLEAAAPSPQPRSKKDMRSAAERKKMNRWSSMPGFGSGSTGKPSNNALDWRSNTVDVSEMR
ncbi:hypothetical protein SLS62_000449 [Diatrype stigma]|uniref:Uncharacterized protein n=1 Tax=Diatrype stigma TaxID=117547 RepID=A0AAN9UXK0_9PEZI